MKINSRTARAWRFLPLALWLWTLPAVAQPIQYDEATKLSYYFQGNAPGIGADVFDAPHATVYYLPGTAGWGTTYGGCPTALWRPRMLSGAASFGVQANAFGFDIAWARGRGVVVEVCTNLASPTWAAVGTNNLSTGSVYFSDPDWVNDPARFYRLRSP